MFEIVIDAELDHESLNSVVLNIAPNANISREFGGDGNSAVVTSIAKTNDAEWPTLACIHSQLDSLCSGTAPISFANSVQDVLGANCITDTCGLVDGLDPDDPYWCLANINGKWHFGSTCGMPLDGPFTDGRETTAGFGKLKLLKQVEMTNLAPNMFHANSVGIPDAG